MGSSWAGFPEVAQQDEDIIGIDQAVFIEVGVGISRIPVGDDIEHVIHIDVSVTSRITWAERTVILDGVAAVVGPVAFNLFCFISAHDGVAEARIAVDSGVDTGANFRNIALDRASLDEAFIVLRKDDASAVQSGIAINQTVLNR